MQMGSAKALRLIVPSLIGITRATSPSSSAHGGQVC